MILSFAFFNALDQDRDEVCGGSHRVRGTGLGKGFNHLRRLSNTSEHGKYRLERELMCFCTNAGRRVFDEHNAKAQAAAARAVGLDSVIGRYPPNYNRLHARSFESLFEIGSRKCTPMALGNDEVARLHSGGRNQFRSDCGAADSWDHRECDRRRPAACWRDPPERR